MCLNNKVINVALPLFLALVGIMVDFSGLIVRNIINWL